MRVKPGRREGHRDLFSILIDAAWNEGKKDVRSVHRLGACWMIDGKNEQERGSLFPVDVKM